VKCEPYDDAHQLNTEYFMLTRLDGVPGVPRVLLRGYDGDNFVFVTDVIGMCLVFCSTLFF
jgi:hypothetical protein